MSADDVDGLIQFDSGRTGITGILHAVIEGGHFMICTIRVGVDDTSHGVSIFTVNARLSRSGIDIGHAVFAIEADMAFGAVDAIDTVFTGNGDTVFSVSTRVVLIGIIAITKKPAFAAKNAPDSV